ncbi:MAG: hypothetical protein AAB853_02180, partial [Patescibacteria group bacterium]
MCKLEVCGNGIRDVLEECDPPDPNGIVRAGDGNTRAGDGCSGTCTAEYCGNVVMERREECDDGGVCNAGTAVGSICTTAAEARECALRGGTCAPTSGDGCSALCRLEAVCGNGILEFREQCDDGGTCIATVPALQSLWSA